MSLRLSLALETGGFALPEEGRIAVFHPRRDHDLAALPKDRLLLIQPMRAEYDAFAAQGYDCRPDLPADMRFAAAVVFLPRAKVQARMNVAQAATATDGPVLVDGAKTDGIDSIYKALRKATSPSAAVSKAHGKVFWFDGEKDLLSDWLPEAETTVEGFLTLPGVFSADGIDPASRLLAEALPGKPGRAVADLGAGWGYLSRQILTHAEVEELHLVEANHDALACARRNVDDPRAAFHWADVQAWKAPGAMNAVVMNPPFHSGRSAEPELGQAFIVAAASMLTASGSLWMVANRHLPYETTLSQRFAHVEEVAGDNRFKVLHASRPKKLRR
ncbi:class I SAM-dependent methyltransferase [Phaeobacter sp. QD34_3]|uniref:class I SAM-dependent methyltransferase n=1 Tax=unclassified Phaeobacter TaxID=2621772 RepID=UPI00237F51FC|nr:MULTISPECIES: class I SAM-dependent methyltransferase [unclassified Phaeobacter]MDE4132553.1 class I SAM-dependent methyltransferase [Phaeobacter sp. QD34_3]MDE4136190.1 class I SAM-dependent methyltransferase [Phaeobacter sp. QD34_24]